MLNKRYYSLLQKTIKEFCTQSLPSLLSTIGSKLPVEEISKQKSARNRLFTVSRTFWLFLHQVLAGNLSLVAIVEVARAWFLETIDVSASPNTSAYSQARKRLPVSFLEDLFDYSTKQLTHDKNFHNYHVKLVDGTGISLQDTQSNRKTFPMHSKAGCYSGFPSFKLVGLFDYYTGAILQFATDIIKTSDSSLYISLWSWLTDKDLVVGDRHFCGFAFFAFLLQLNVNMMTRKHQMRKHQKVVKILGEGDKIVRWEKPKGLPKWLCNEEWEKLPDYIDIREITFTTGENGFRSKTITITTTLLNEEISAYEWAELYFQRWKVELFFRDIKITMGMDILKGKTPDMVGKEVFLYCIAYNLIRMLMREAAEANNKVISKISFKSTMTAIQLWSTILSRTKSQKEYERYYLELLKAIAYPQCRNKKYRSEPRAKKRRGKNFQLLTGDRNEFIPIPHRNKHKKVCLT